MSSSGELQAIGRRIEGLSTHPEQVRARWYRLWRPVLRTFGWQPRFTVSCAIALLDAMDEPGPADLVQLSTLLGAAETELEENVAAAERGLVVNRRMPIAQAAWLRRLYEVVVRASRAIRRASTEGAPLGPAPDRARVLPPLAIAVAPPGDAAGAGEAGSPVDTPQPAGLSFAVPTDVRLVDLELAAIDQLVDAAIDETEFLGRRRRLLEAARRMLLESAAALPLDPEGVEARRRLIAEGIVRVDRLEAAGLSPEVGLTHQARSAMSRADRQRLHAALVAIDGFAQERGDEAALVRTSEALRRLGSRDDPATRAASLQRSAREALGEVVFGAVRAAYAAARAAVPAATESEDLVLRERAVIGQSYLAEELEGATLSGLLAVDGSFEVGGTLAPVRVVELQTRAVSVATPTQDLMLVPAEHIGDVPNAVIEDPRTLLLALAQGRLLARRYVRFEEVPRRRTVLTAEARVYLLDGSGSMHYGRSESPGARARMRDALLLAELATLRARTEDARRTTRAVLFYRYFDTHVGPLRRVDTGAEALAAMTDVLATIRTGGTDIEAALEASFAQVRAARADDPELSRAQIVLVTDGEARVRESVIDEARRGLEGVPIGLSVIALGQENAALRSLVARQRERGERAFYHHVDDAALCAVAGGAVDRGRAIHLPEVAEGPVAPLADRARELDALLGGLVDELATRERARGTTSSRRDDSVEAIEASEHERAALVELEVAPDDDTAGVIALRQARSRDGRALEASFVRWFAAPSRAALGSVGPPLPDGDEDAVLVVLATVAEVVSELGGSPLARRAEAIGLLERLLPDARLSPARYDAVLAGSDRVAPGLLAVQRAASPSAPS